MKKILALVLTMTVIAAVIPMFPSLKAEVEPVKVEAKDPIVKKLMSDEKWVEPMCVESGQEVILDLNGFSIEDEFPGDFYQTMIIVRGKGKLTVKNSANVQGTITAKGGSLRSLATVEDGELKVEGGKFKAENHISTVELSATDPSKNSEFILDGAASLNSTDKSC